MTLNYLEFDYSEDAEGIGTFETLAAVARHLRPEAQERQRRLDADRRQDHRRWRRGPDLGRLHDEGPSAHEGPRLSAAAKCDVRTRRAMER